MKVKQHHQANEHEQEMKLLHAKKARKLNRDPSPYEMHPAEREQHLREREEIRESQEENKDFETFGVPIQKE